MRVGPGFDQPGSRLRRALAALALAAVACLAAGSGAVRPLTQFKVDGWQTEQGLPLNTVQALLQTRDGYLWVGTMGGLARFDGVRFKTFDPRSVPELGFGSIFGLMEDAEGNLWIGRSGAAVLYRNGGFRVAFDETVTDGRRVWSFCQDAAGVVWAATENGLVRWEKGSVRVFRRGDGLPTDKLRSVAFDRDGTLWIGTTGGGLVSFAGGRFRTYGRADGLPNQEVRAVLPDPDGSLWAATAGGGLARFSQGRFQVFGPAQGLPTGQLTALARDREGTLWVGTWGAGLSCLRDGRFSTLDTAGGLAGNQIWSLCADREGCLWVGTWVGGLNRLRQRHFRTFGVPEGLSHDNVRAVLHGRDGVLWAATGGGGVNRIDPSGTVTSIRTRDGLPSDEASSLCEGLDGSLWIGTNTGGVAWLRNGRLTRFGTAQGLPSNDVRALLQDRGGTLWAGTVAGLARFDGRRFVPVRRPGAPADAVTTLFEDRGGTLWLGTAGRGLVRFRDGEFRAFTRKDGLASNWIMALHEDAQGSLWIGTNGGGLSRLRHERVASILPVHGLWDPIVQAILEDADGRFWMTCNRGFFSTSRADLDAVADGRRDRIESRGFGPGDGLRSTTFSGGQQPSGARDARGRLWLPTYRGLVVVDPADLPGPRPAPPVLFEDVTVDNVERPGGAEVVLPPGSAPLSIRYTAMTLIEPEAVRFRYRMDGSPGGWREVGSRREAFFPGLPHGRYQFRVEASVDGRTWRPAPAALSVRVQPFFFQTAWFSLLLGAAVLVAAGTVYGLRTVHFRRRQADMERQVREKTEALRQANEELSRLSFLDALTGLANRRCFDEALEKEWRRAQRFRTPLALVIADVDAFKAYNDALGHPEGDRCLAAVAGVFRESVGRAGDLAARYGGEEFVVLVPGADLGTARALAEKLRRDCEGLAIPHPASPAGPWVTLSAGAAACQPEEGLAMASLLAEADAALYRAKHGGRNRVG